MWAYTSANELYHYGVMGMKWGKRKSQQPISTTKAAYNSAKKSKNEAGRAYRKEWNKTAANPFNSFTKKGNEKWNVVEEKAKNSAKADAAFKKAKDTRNKAIKNKTKELNSKAKISEKILYNNATRKRAAKYIIDNDMSVADATRKAKDKAIKNTSNFLVAYGALTVAMGVAAGMIRK